MLYIQTYFAYPAYLALYPNMVHTYLILDELQSSHTPLHSSPALSFSPHPQKTLPPTRTHPNFESPRADSRSHEPVLEKRGINIHARLINCKRLINFIFNSSMMSIHLISPQLGELLFFREI